MFFINKGNVTHIMSCFLRNYLDNKLKLRCIGINALYLSSERKKKQLFFSNFVTDLITHI